jgi:hypothetical protein
MSSFQADSAKKHITEITADYRPFWQSVFDKTPTPNPQFSAKLCYMGKEFSGGSSREECVRFFPNELNNEDGIYCELFNWEQGHYHEGFRVLYHLPFDPHWRTNPDFKEVTTTASGAKLTTPTYVVRVNKLKLINKTSVKALVPEPMTTASAEMPAVDLFSATVDDLLNEDKYTEMFSEMEDDHYTKMTIRDLYCVLQNVPLSNKKWLNQLIEKGKSWQKK